MANDLWYAVCIGDFDDDLGYGAFTFTEAYEMALKHKEDNKKIVIYTVDTKDAFVLDEYEII